ncbi:MAG: MFS transporter, partial [Desulfomonilaceae bacterium]
MQKTAAPNVEVVPYRWVILIIMVACFLFTFVIRFTWPPLIPVVVPALNMKMAQAGAFMSAFYFGYIVTQIPAGLLADRFGVRLLLTLSLIIEGIATFAMAYINTFEQGFWLRALTGLGAGAVYSACARSLMEWFPPEERGTAFGVMLAAVSGGIVISGFIMPPLNASFGWTGAFQVVGAATILMGILIFFLVKSSTVVVGGSMLEGFKILFRNKDLIFTSLSGFCLLWVELGAATWTVAYVKKLGFGLKEA